MMREFKDFAGDYIDGLKKIIDETDIDTLEKITAEVERTLENGNLVIAFGNGGSAATASHFCSDLNKCASEGRDKKFKAICLSDNVHAMMSYANDISYSDIFIEPLKNFMSPGDLIMAFSGSGNSENVIKAVKYANEKGNITVGICGYDGGLLKKISKYPLHVNINDMQKSEDMHVVFTHIIIQRLMKTSC